MVPAFSGLHSHVIILRAQILLFPHALTNHCFAVLPDYVAGGWTLYFIHDDVIKWKHFPRNWPFVRKIHRSPVNFPHKGQWRGALMFTLICDRMNGWVNNHEAGDSRRYLAHCDVIVMKKLHFVFLCKYYELCLALVAVVYDFTSTTIYYLWDHIFLSSNPGTREKSFSTETCRAITDIKVNVP